MPTPQVRSTSPARNRHRCPLNPPDRVRSRRRVHPSAARSRRRCRQRRHDRPGVTGRTARAGRSPTPLPSPVRRAGGSRSVPGRGRGGGHRRRARLLGGDDDGASPPSTTAEAIPDRSVLRDPVAPERRRRRCPWRRVVPGQLCGSRRRGQRRDRVRQRPRCQADHQQQCISRRLPSAGPTLCVVLRSIGPAGRVSTDFGLRVFRLTVVVPCHVTRNTSYSTPSVAIRPSARNTDVSSQA